MKYQKYQKYQLKYQKYQLKYQKYQLKYQKYQLKDQNCQFTLKKLIYFDFFDHFWYNLISFQLNSIDFELFNLF